MKSHFIACISRTLTSLCNRAHLSPGLFITVFDNRIHKMLQFQGDCDIHHMVDLHSSQTCCYITYLTVCVCLCVVTENVQGSRSLVKNNNNNNLGKAE